MTAFATLLPSVDVDGDVAAFAFALISVHCFLAMLFGQFVVVAYPFSFYIRCSHFVLLLLL